MNSMTGFGRGQALAEGLQVTVELASVNRRNLDVSTSIPKDWQFVERLIVSRIREHFGRGKIHASLNVESTETLSDFQWDETAAVDTLERMKAFAKTQGLACEPGPDALIRLLSLHRVSNQLPDKEVLEALVIDAVQKAIEELSSMRFCEGEALKVDLQERMSRIEAHVSQIEMLAAESVPNYRDHLMSRLKQLGLEIDLDDERVLKEVAMFADRCDITEELTRFQSHINQFNETLEPEDDGEGKLNPIGRKLEFILQEINRETNTTGSKANNIEISKLVIDIKNELERIREQIQNVE